MLLGAESLARNHSYLGVCQKPLGNVQRVLDAVLAQQYTQVRIGIERAARFGALHARNRSQTADHEIAPLPVFGVPVESKTMSGLDSLYSIVQMPPGVPVGTLAIGKGGAINAALLAASVLALSDAALATRLEAWRKAQTDAVAEIPSDEGKA